MSPDIEVNSRVPTAKNYQSAKNTAENSNTNPTSENTHITNDNPSGFGGFQFAFPSLGRQSSVYSLTLDQFQRTLSESGKDFGSMNMDEFLSSIWVAEENQNQNQSTCKTPMIISQSGVGSEPNSSRKCNDNTLNKSVHPFLSDGLMKQPSLPRQDSLTLPVTLCCKTVDEVWSQIQRTEHQDQTENDIANCSTGGNDSQRQHTFKEMTLEDFLIKAGVVQEQCPSTSMVLPPLPAQPKGYTPQMQPSATSVQTPQYGFNQSANNPQVSPTLGPRPMAGLLGGYQSVAQNGTVTKDPSAYGVNGAGKMNKDYVPAEQQTHTMCHDGIVGNGPVGGYMAGLRITSPVSPMSVDVLAGPGLVGGRHNQYGMDVGAFRGRKRPLGGPTEKVVERRQKRMIKNRESAARSRARKQAYTSELEAEINQLREENTQLKQSLAEMQQEQNEQNVEQQMIMPQARMERTQDQLRIKRRGRSCPL